MPRFARMLTEGMKARGHTIQIFSPEGMFVNLPGSSMIKKWLGYVDQFIVFPFLVKKSIKAQPANSLFIFTDHALGPWVPLTAKRHHVIHCHDFLAQASAMDMVPQNPTGWTGKKYQQLIRRGYAQGKNFISVSEKTRSDLHHFLGHIPSFSEVVYNGLNQKFVPRERAAARATIGKRINLDVTEGYFLHVGGNQWYKNRVGVLTIYEAWRKSAHPNRLALLMVGETPDKSLMDAFNSSTMQSDIHFITDLEDHFIGDAYSGASLFLFPSLAEGFGWPIAEAMACGCLTITTNEAPMTEVAGDAGFLIPAAPEDVKQQKEWATSAADVVSNVIGLSEENRLVAVAKGIHNAERFNTDDALNKIESIYNALVLK
ncbi:MAG: glycosyltransferase [Chryseolinea sp.]